jgi:hypothetical protein
MNIVRFFIITVLLFQLVTRGEHIKRMSFFAKNICEMFTNKDYKEAVAKKRYLSY